ncbi:glycosyltransferase family 2 protein [Haloplanus halophilus]|uniref:glycosyltransferase family 2 protein n=1 Tax=Haloplanus halophilus TaxID=2949993 RepID=UPI00203D786D|nr:glycosyltransferase family 2 protein [Haloplanus sp. GDY1]
MKVSVIIPTYNRQEKLPRAIDSVLKQTHTDLELIIVDDGSTDNTQKVVESYTDKRISFHKHDTNINASAARNTGIDYTTGEYIAFLDSDDEWKPNKLKLQLEKLENKGDSWVGAYCDIDIQHTGLLKPIRNIIHKNNNLKEGDKELIKEILQLDLLPFTSTLIVKSDIVNEISGFDERFERHQDYEFLIRLLQKGKLACVSEPLVKIYESENPDPEVIHQAKKLLFDEFSDIIEDLENDGYDIKSPHHFQLSRLYFSTGEFREGMRQMQLCNSIETKKYPLVFWSSCVGLLTKFSFYES